MLLTAMEKVQEIWNMIKPVAMTILQSGFIMTAIYAIERGVIINLTTKKTDSIGTQMSKMGTDVVSKIANSTIKVNVKPLVDMQFKEALAQTESYITDSMKNIKKENNKCLELQTNLLIDMAKVFANAYGVDEELKAKMDKDIKALESYKVEEKTQVEDAVLTIKLEDVKEVEEKETFEVENTLDR